MPKALAEFQFTGEVRSDRLGEEITAPKWRLMPRPTSSAVLFFAGAVLLAGPPPKVEPTKSPPSGVGALSITGTEASAADADAVEVNVVMLPGAPATPLAARAERSAAEAPGRASLSLPEPPAAQPAALALLRVPAPLKLSGPALQPWTAARPKLPEDFERDGASYLQRRLGVWREEDAVRLFGTAVRQRQALDPEKKPDGRIVAFSDPSRRYREFELDFDGRTGYLRTVFVYPWKMKWDDCRRMWGNDVMSTQAANGRWFHSYEKRRLDVLVDGSGAVVSLGLY
jgi:hypothetical protein